MACRSRHGYRYNYNHNFHQQCFNNYNTSTNRFTAGLLALNTIKLYGNKRMYYSLGDRIEVCMSCDLVIDLIGFDTQMSMN